MTDGYIVKGVLFDFDGTLTRPGALDFKVIKAALGCPSHVSVLAYIDAMHEDAERQAALAQLDQFEMQGARCTSPNQSAQEVVEWVKSQYLPVGIITRNSRMSVLRALENFDRLGAENFDLILTRDDPPAVKPSGDGIVWCARQWHLPTAEMLIVGDYIFDPQAGRAAGALTALLDPDNDPRLAAVACDFRISDLAELPNIIEAGRE